MFVDFSRVRIFLKPGATDLRKQINGLSIIVCEEMELDAFSGNLFLFCNKMRNRLKIVYWDKTGFCLWLKRLEHERFPWPRHERETLEIDGEKLRMLLKGIDFFKAHKEVKYFEIN